MTATWARELKDCYAGKKVWLTGHTGFKGGWLLTWLQQLGAQVSGYALAPEPHALFRSCELTTTGAHVIGDLRDLQAVESAFLASEADIVFHLGAQALVRQSYSNPIETLSTNVMGTAHVLEAVRKRAKPCAVVVVSSDKCYENREWVHGYREDDAMGGHDVYSMSKGCTELATASWRRSFFSAPTWNTHRISVASARAGNVIGGGDWAADRLVPDCVAALRADKAIEVRNPNAIRPWQHVLEPLSGYLQLGAKLLGAQGSKPVEYAEAFNFGPTHQSVVPVRTLVETMVRHWGKGHWSDVSNAAAVHEAQLLRLSIDKATARLGWQPRWDFEATIGATIEWYRAQHDGHSAQQLRQLSVQQIERFSSV